MNNFVEYSVADDHFKMSYYFDKTNNFQNNFKKLLIEFCKTIQMPGIMFGGGQDSLLVAHSFHEADNIATHITYKMYDGYNCLNEYESSFADKFCKDYKKEQIIRNMDYQQLVELYLNTDVWFPHPDLFMQWYSCIEYGKKYNLCFGQPAFSNIQFRKNKLCILQTFMGLKSTLQINRKPYSRLQSGTTKIGSAFLFNDFLLNIKDPGKGDFETHWKNEYYKWLGYDIEFQEKTYIMPSQVKEFKELKAPPIRWKSFISIPYNTLVDDYNNKDYVTYRSN